jgi:acyl-CoA synthetase (NDP forming)
MKKTALCFMVMFMSLLAFPDTVMASESPFTNPTEKTEEIPDEVKLMVDRVDEIKEMDRSNLSREEKKELRKELREIKKDLKKRRGSGLYISTGAIIIILLLIIIL